MNVAIAITPVAIAPTAVQPAAVTLSSSACEINHCLTISFSHDGDFQFGSVRTAMVQWGQMHSTLRQHSMVAEPALMYTIMCGGFGTIEVPIT